MNDDIRSRLRGGGKGYSSRRMPGYLRSDPPSPRSLRPKPVAKQAKLPEFKTEPIKPAPIAKPVRKRKKAKKKFLPFLIILLIAAGAGGYWYKYHIQPQRSHVQQLLTKTEPALKPTGTIRLIATGDNLTFDSINQAAKKPDGSYDFSTFFPNIKPFFDKSDIKVCNETVPAAGTLYGISGFPNFNAPPAFAKGLGDLGCNVINMGTNHINDKGQPAIDTSVGYWDNQSSVLAVAGANRTATEQKKIRYFTVKQVKLAYLSYTTTSNDNQLTPFGVNIYNAATAQAQVQEAQKNAQFVIVSMNWGTENSGDITPDQDKIAQNLTDWGADIIIGSGPHVLQPAKILNGKNGHQSLVWYSLGNFLNSEIPIENLVGGIAVMNIDVASLHITNPSFLPVYMHYEWTAAQKQSQSQADLQARHNFLLYPLDQATDALFASGQTNTTVKAQTDRVTAIMTKFAPIKVITSAQF